jgi:hypothetical protein
MGRVFTKGLLGPNQVMKITAMRLPQASIITARGTTKPSTRNKSRKHDGPTSSINTRKTDEFPIATRKIRHVHPIKTSRPDFMSGSLQKPIPAPPSPTLTKHMHVRR